MFLKMNKFIYRNAILLYYMAKNSQKQIEEDEKKILCELSKNANKSINEIAKTCGFSRQKVWRIIKNLEKNNTIWGYIAVINEEKQNKHGFIVLIKRSHVPFDKEPIEKIVSRELAQRVEKSGVELINSIYTNGEYDWVINFTATNIKEAKSFVELLTNIFSGYISEMHLLEEMFSASKNGITNPEIERFREFFEF